MLLTKEYKYNIFIAKRFAEGVSQRFSGNWDELMIIYKDRDFPLVIGGYPVGLFGTLSHLLGYENLFYYYYDKPDLIKDMLNTFTDLWVAIWEEVLARIDIDAVIVSDALDSVHCFPSYTPYFEIEGVPPVMSCPVSCAQRMRFSTKPSRGAQPTDSFIWETQLAQAVNAQLMGCVEGAAPLSLAEDPCNAAFYYLEAGFPIYIASGSLMGASHPITIAGATVSHNAELLAIVVLIQCIKPGSGIIANNFVSGMNMQTGDLNFGTAAVSLHQMAYNQIWHDHYRIPINNTGAAFSNSKMIDYQTAAEKLPVAMCSALSGANLIVLHGGVTGELAYNPILVVIDDDIAKTIGRIIEGFDIKDDLIGLDVIKQVGIGGTFLNTKQTRTLWQSEDYMPKVFDKTSYQEWVSGGKKTVIEKAKERMKEILATHKPDPLTGEQEKDIEKILKEATGYYEKKGLI